jgi:uncharacterized membrane protein
MRFARLTYTAILSGALVWCALILLAPAAASSSGFGPLGSLVYAFFSPLCHQIASRSFHLFGEPLAVCGRCSAIYFGFLAGTIIYPLYRMRKGSPRAPQPGRMYLILSILPVLVDFTLEAAGVYDSSNVIRAATGAWFGVMLPFLIIPGAVEGVSQLFARPKPQAVTPVKGLIDA